MDSTDVAHVGQWNEEDIRNEYSHSCSELYVCLCTCSECRDPHIANNYLWAYSKNVFSKSLIILLYNTLVLLRKLEAAKWILQVYAHVDLWNKEDKKRVLTSTFRVQRRPYPEYRRGPARCTFGQRGPSGPPCVSWSTSWGPQLRRTNITVAWNTWNLLI